jgi:hypothetical protein
MNFKAVLTVLTILVVISVATGADIGTSTAKAHAPWKHKEGELFTPKRHFLKFLRTTIHQERDKRCLTNPKLRPVWSIKQWNRVEFIDKWMKSTLPNIKAKKSRCLPTDPRAIIRYVFPDATEEAALRVSGCETGWTWYPRAKNPHSSASGLFQLIGFHWEGKFDPFDPWENTRYAARLSSQHDGQGHPIPGTAGTNWSAWVCKP